MNDVLTIDEFDALGQIARGLPAGRPSACVARNSKRLVGLKYIAHEKNGSFILTDKGKQTLFVKRCIDGLRTVASDPQAALANDVATFLGKKGHIVPNATTGGFDITQKGRESLADIDGAER